MHVGREGGTFKSCLFSESVLATTNADIIASNSVDFSLQMTLGQMKAHLRENADENGNLWCHQEGCRGTYTPYRVNTWGLRKTGTNKEEGREMVDQQVTNILRHLEKVHNIPKHEVTEDVLPKKTPPFPGREHMSCYVSLAVCELSDCPI